MKTIFAVAALAALSACAQIESATGIPKVVLDIAACEAIKAGGTLLVGPAVVSIATASIDLIDGCGEIGVALE